MEAGKAVSVAEGAEVRSAVQEERQDSTQTQLPELQIQVVAAAAPIQKILTQVLAVQVSYFCAGWHPQT
jgi:hypothetical protein